jgi:hypothetical protein
LRFLQFDRQRLRDAAETGSSAKEAGRKLLSLQELAKRDRISRRYIRRPVGLAFLSPRLVEAILQGRQPVELTATRLTELDLPLDWGEQHRLLTT